MDQIVVSNAVTCLENFRLYDMSIIIFLCFYCSIIFIAVPGKWCLMLPGMCIMYQDNLRHVLCCLYITFHNIKTVGFKLGDVVGNIKVHLLGITCYKIYLYDLSIGLDKKCLKMFLESNRFS